MRSIMLNVKASSHKNYVQRALERDLSERNTH